MTQKSDKKGRFATVSLLLIVPVALALIITIVGCSNNAQKEKLRANIDAPSGDVDIKEMESVYFQAKVTGGEPPYKYKWHFGTAAPDTFKKDVYEITFKFEGAYKVMLTVTDSTGRQVNDSILVVVEPKKVK